MLFLFPFFQASGTRTEQIEFVLKKLGIDKYFKIVCGVEQTKKGKPEPDIFLLAAKKIGLEPEECLIIEDSKAGIEAAKRAGIRYVCMKSEINQHLKKCEWSIYHYKEFPLKILEEKKYD